MAINFEELKKNATTKYQSITVDFEYDGELRSVKLINLLLQKPSQRAELSAILAEYDTDTGEDGKFSDLTDGIEKGIAQYERIILAAASDKKAAAELVEVCDSQFPILEQIVAEYLEVTKPGEAKAS